MNQEQYKILSAWCKRCGKKIITSNRSLIGSKEAEKFQYVCFSCMKPEEINALDKSVEDYVKAECGCCIRKDNNNGKE